jgi:hypothetical protein
MLAVSVAGPVALLATLRLSVIVLLPLNPAIEAGLVQVIICPEAVQVQPGVVETKET